MLNLLSGIGFALVAAIAGFVFYLYRSLKQSQKEVQDLKVKGFSDDAKVAVSKKTAIDLVNDYNARYPLPPSGDDHS